MTELDLFKFIQDHNSEYHWHGEEIYFFVGDSDFKDFISLLPYSIFDDSGIDCKLKDGYLVFEMIGICDYCGIDPKRVFKEGGWHG